MAQAPLARLAGVWPSREDKALSLLLILKGSGLLSVRVDMNYFFLGLRVSVNDAIPVVLEMFDPCW